MAPTGLYAPLLLLVPQGNIYTLQAIMLLLRSAKANPSELADFASSYVPTKGAGPTFANFQLLYAASPDPTTSLLLNFLADETSFMPLVLGVPDTSPLPSSSGDFATFTKNVREMWKSASRAQFAADADGIARASTSLRELYQAFPPHAHFSPQQVCVLERQYISFLKDMLVPGTAKTSLVPTLDMAFATLTAPQTLPRFLEAVAALFVLSPVERLAAYFKRDLSPLCSDTQFSELKWSKLEVVGAPSIADLSTRMFWATLMIPAEALSAMLDHEIAFLSGCAPAVTGPLDPAALRLLGIVCSTHHNAAECNTAPQNKKKGRMERKLKFASNQ